MQHHFLATAVADAAARRDPQPLSTLLTETVRLRALLPGGLVESHGRADAVARFLGWFADFDAVEVVEAAGEAVADRVLIHYRLGLSRAAPSHATQRWVCTQTAIGKVVDGRLAVVDLLCSGFREIENLRGDRER